MRRWTSAIGGAACGLAFAAVLPVDTRLHLVVAGVILAGALVSWAIKTPEEPDSR